jgi:hypothetical protein
MNSQRATPEQRRERAKLDARADAGFGRIGISAVAAAMRYQSEIKNSAYAPAKISATEPAEEAVA